MAFWNFWKKKDDVAEFEKELGLGPKDRLGMEKTEEEFDRLAKPEEPLATEQKEYELNKPIPEPQQKVQDHDVQIISAKLDTIKSMLELINQRLNTLEKHNEEKKKIW